MQFAQACILTSGRRQPARGTPPGMDAIRNIRNQRRGARGTQRMRTGKAPRQGAAWEGCEGRLAGGVSNLP